FRALDAHLRFTRSTSRPASEFGFSENLRLGTMPERPQDHIPLGYPSNLGAHPRRAASDAAPCSAAAGVERRFFPTPPYASQPSAPAAIKANDDGSGTAATSDGEKLSKARPTVVCDPVYTRRIEKMSADP